MTTKTYNTDPIEKLYRVVKDKGYYTKSIDEFRNKYNTPESIDILYGVVNDKKLYTKSKDDFYSQYFPTLQPVKKKESGDFPLLYNRQKTTSLPSNLVSGGLLPSKEKTRVEKLEMQPVNKPLTDKEAEEEATSTIINSFQNGETDDPVKEAINKFDKNEDFDVTKARNNTKLFLNKLKVANNIFSADDSKKTVQDYANYNGGELTGDLDKWDISTIESKLPKDNMTANLAFKQYKKKRQIDSLINNSASLEDMAASLSGEDKKDISEARMGQLLYDLTNDPYLQDKIRTNPEFNKKYFEAKGNLYSRYPSFASKKVRTELAQKLEDEKMTGWFYSNPDIATTDKAAKMLMDEGKWTEQDKYFYEKNIRPDIEAGKGAKTLPTTDLAHRFGQGIYKGLKGIASSARDLTNKATFGGLQNIGVFETDEDRAKRLEQEEYGTPTVTPSSEFRKIISTGGEFTGFTVPMIAGSLAKVPPVATGIMMFEGENADRALRLFPKDKEKQALYTLLGTTIDASLMELLPTKKASAGIKKLIEKDAVNVIDQLANKNITQETAKQTLLNKIEGYAKSLGVNNFKTANALTGFTLAHNGLDAAFGKRDFKLEDEVHDALKEYKTNFLSSTPLSAFASVGGRRTEGKTLKEIADNYDEYKSLIDIEAKKNPELAKEKMENLDHIKAVSDLLDKRKMDETSKENYIRLSLKQKIAQDNIKNNPDKELASEDKKVSDLASIEKERIANPEMTNTEFIQKLYDKELLPKGSMELLSNSENKKFDPTKVGEYLKYIAQQSNGLDENWQPREGGKPKMQVPESVIELANEKWADEIDAATEPKEAVTPIEKTVESEPTVSTEQKSILNSETDLTGDVKEIWMLPVKKQEGESTKGIAPKGGKEVQFGGLQLSSIARAIKDGDYQKAIKDGRMTANDAKEIIESGNFEVPKDIIADAKKENNPLKIVGEESQPIKEEVKSTENAIPIESTNEIDVRQQASNGERMGEGNIQPEKLTGKEKESENTGEEKRTGIKNEVSKSIRIILDLPKVDVPKLGKDAAIIGEGKELVDSGEIDPTEVVNRINSTDNHNMSRSEAKAMQYYMHQLGQHEDTIREHIAESSDPDVKASYVGLLQQLSDLQDAATEANIKAGKDWSDVGNIRQILIDQNFNPSRDKAIIKDAYGGEIPNKTKLVIDKIIKERDEAIQQRNKVEEILRQKEAEAKFSKMKTESKGRKGDFKERIKSLKDELIAAKEEHEKWLKDNGIQKSGVGFVLTGKMIKIIGKMGVEYAGEGLRTVEELINKVYEEIKDHLPLASKKDVRDAIALYEAEKITTKAERIEDKITPPILDKKGKPSEPAPIEPIPKLKLKFKTNTEWVKANQRVANAEYKLKVQKRLAFESQKNMYQKGLMWAGRLTRLSVLSGYNVLYKLAAAATIGGAVKRMPEQAIGRIYQTVFKGIAEKAPIEGYINAKSEAKFYKEFFNPKKFVKNSWEILKTGESDLNKRFGGGGYEHVPLLYLPTDLHQIIKDPVKRSTFEASFRNSLIWAEKNGLDINDPLVINSLETAAYKRGNYEIFQESNWLTRKFGEWKSKMEKNGLMGSKNAGNTAKFIADFMIPVSTVPTNIVRRLTTTSPFGLLRGSKMVLDAYRKGIESLEPEQADAVMKQLKQGTFGTALWLIGWFAASHFGGMYSKYNPNKQRDEGDLASDEMEVNGEMIPKSVQHALPFEIIQWAATARHIYDNYKDNKDKSTFESLYHAGMGSIGAVAEHIPIIETATHVSGAFDNPYEAEKLKDDVKRRFQPQILRETGVIKKKDTNENPRQSIQIQKRQTRKQRIASRKERKSQ